VVALLRENSVRKRGDHKGRAYQQAMLEHRAGCRRPLSIWRDAAPLYGVELTPENGPQSLTGGTAVPTLVLSEGEFSKSNMSSSVSAN
jgi:hypothetical protein